MHCLLVLPMCIGVLCLSMDAFFIGAPNVCRVFVCVSFKDSLLVWMHCLLVLLMFVGALCLFLAMTLYWYRCIVYWCSQCL